MRPHVPMPGVSRPWLSPTPGKPGKIIPGPKPSVGRPINA